MFSSLRALTARIAQVSTLLLLVGTLAACEFTVPTPGEPPTVNELLGQRSDLSTLAAAVDAAGLGDALDGDGPLTVFAPANAAFGALTVDALLADPDLLAEVLQYHVVAGSFEAADLSDGQTLATLQGDSLRVTVADGAVQINGATVTTANLRASNGVVHVIDEVLLANRSAVERLSVTAATQSLVDAVVAAGLADAVAGAENWTIFAPTDSAFAGVDVSGLTQEQLAAVIQYHVVAADAPIAAADLVALLESNGGEVSVETLQGESITFRAEADGSIVLNDGQATLVPDGLDLYTDGFANIVHLIDGVLLPPSLSGD